MNQASALKLVTHKYFDRFITTLIILNAITLGVETSKSLHPDTVAILYTIDTFFIIIFTFELLLRLIAFRSKFFGDGWRIFDSFIIFVSWLPASHGFAILRSLRVLRTIRIITVVPELRRVVEGLFKAIPGLMSVIAILSLVFYVSSVMATNLFGSNFAEWFGSVGKSAYTLFQVMTLESWSMGIVRPVMEQYPKSWIFFLAFIFFTTFIMLNLFIGVIVSSMQAETEIEAQKRAEESHQERVKIVEDIREIKELLSKLAIEKDPLIFKKSDLKSSRESYSSGEH